MFDILGRIVFGYFIGKLFISVIADETVKRMKKCDGSE